MSLRFVPPKQVARYALFVDHGNGKGFFKPYNELGHAKLGYYHHGRHYDSKILETVAGEWYTLFEIPAGTERSQLPWVGDVQQGWRNNWGRIRRAVPMTREEYAEWRIRVERERIEREFDISLVSLNRA